MLLNFIFDLLQDQELLLIYQKLNLVKKLMLGYFCHETDQRYLVLVCNLLCDLSVNWQTLVFREPYCLSPDYFVLQPICLHLFSSSLSYSFSICLCHYSSHALAFSNTPHLHCRPLSHPAKLAQRPNPSLCVQLINRLPGDWTPSQRSLPVISGELDQPNGHCDRAAVKKKSSSRCKVFMHLDFCEQTSKFQGQTGTGEDVICCL